MRALSAFAAGLGLALLVVGVALYPMMHPTFTKLLSQRYSLVAQSGLSQPRILSIAEQVREFVVDGDMNSLPATVDGRQGFDAGAVSHLRDVRRVLDGARLVTGVLAALMAVWLGTEIVRRRFSAIAEGLFVGAGLSVLMVVLAVVAGCVSFDAFFAWFHGLFFSAGTWQFAENSLLIEVFPEGFWIASGVIWGLEVIVGAVIFGVAGWLVRGVQTRG